MYVDEHSAQTRPSASLRQSVNSGEISLHPEAGDRLAKLLAAQLDQAEEWLERIARLSRPAPLGTNAIGKAMSAKFEQRAKGDEENSFYSVVQAYRDVLKQTDDAIRSAIRNYRTTDEDQAQAFRAQVG